MTSQSKKNSQSWSLLYVFLVVGVIIYIFLNPLYGDTESLHNCIKKVTYHPLRVLFHVSYILTFIVLFLAFIVFFCLILKAELQIKATLSLQYGLR